MKHFHNSRPVVRHNKGMERHTRRGTKSRFAGISSAIKTFSGPSREIPNRHFYSNGDALSLFLDGWHGTHRLVDVQETLLKKLRRIEDRYRLVVAEQESAVCKSPKCACAR
jgi:hypothetical protein